MPEAAIYGTPEWVEERKTYIGASEVAAVCGLSPWDSPRKIYEIKKGLRTFPSTLPMKVGLALEELVAQEFCDYMGIDPAELEKCGLVRHQEHQFCGCNPDRLWPKCPDGKAVVQLKTCNQYASGDFGKTGSDEVKDEYIVQIGWEMWLCKAEIGYMPVLIGNSDFRVFVFTWTKSLTAIVKQAAESVNKFWHFNILADNPPPLTGMDVDRDLVRDTYTDPTDDIAPANDEVEELLVGEQTGAIERVASWPEVCAQVRKWDLEQARRENVLREAIGNYSGIQTSQGIATWRKDKNGKRVLRYGWKKEAA